MKSGNKGVACTLKGCNIISSSREFSPEYVLRSETFTADFYVCRESLFFFADISYEGEAMVVVNVVILVIAFAALIKGADVFVEGSSALARLFRISGVVIGLTVVAMGTSMPELAVSVSAAVQGSSEIALSNVVGSNIFNLLGVLGLCAVIKALPVDTVILKRDFSVSAVSTAAVFTVSSAAGLFSKRFFNLDMGAVSGTVSRLSGIILVAAFIVYIVYLIFDARKHPCGETGGIKHSLWKCLLLITIGLVLIIIGGKAVVDSARNIARFFGMSETLIGLTIVAVGTSLPELVTSVVAAGKGEVALAAGNILGSNIFNLLFILGFSAVIHPVSVNTASVYDMFILIAVTVMTWIFSLSGRKITRAEGWIMLMCYAASTVFAVLR
ncbi:cation:H+ antiporter [Treponema rectale]|uniref:Cation:H+ antiporter n=1 Tax=Treponema rectale TaxID=744512 RepID=A0A840S9S0_9SPIR|nr:calcium/sodium antiporter [Treponema rectale]MBB5219439.1 cation:H+ antiporter [Treponema rectale]